VPGAGRALEKSLQQLITAIVVLSGRMLLRNCEVHRARQGQFVSKLGAAVIPLTEDRAFLLMRIESVTAS
jgi:hypothetical protein